MTLPTTIGQAFGGGYYIGDITIADGGDDDGEYCIIMAGGEGQAILAWKDPRSATPGTHSNTNGLANTLTMQANNPVIHYAGMHCLNYLGGDYDDWYMPAPNEMELAWTNRAFLATLAMESQFYWTSIQSPANPGNIAVGVSFSDGARVGLSKNDMHRVRPVRRISKSQPVYDHTINLRVGNNGPKPSPNTIVIFDNLQHLDREVFELSKGAFESWEGAQVWNVGTLATDETAEISLGVTNSSGADVTLTAHISGPNIDPNPANNVYEKVIPGGYDGITNMIPFAGSGQEQINSVDYYGNAGFQDVTVGVGPYLYGGLYFHALIQAWEVSDGLVGLYVTSEYEIEQDGSDPPVDPVDYMDILDVTFVANDYSQELDIVIGDPEGNGVVWVGQLPPGAAEILLDDPEQAFLRIRHRNPPLIP